MNASTSYSRSMCWRPRPTRRDELVVPELGEADDADPAPTVEQLLDPLDEVSVVADQEHVVVTVGESGQGPLDRDVDDLLVGSHRTAAPGR